MRLFLGPACLALGRVGGVAVAAVVSCLAAGCNRSAPGAGAPAPPEVTVSRPVVKEVTEWDEYPGRLAAVDTVNVASRVSGFIDTAPFNEGSIVTKDKTVLFVLDLRPFQAALNQANASLARAQAQEQYATGEFHRYEEIRATGAVAETQYATARQAMLSARAAATEAAAAAQTAQLNFDWATVYAPINGRVGAKRVTPGNLVIGGDRGQATVLTTITSLDPIYCYIDVDERSVRRYQEMVTTHARPSARDVPLPCEMAVTGETGYPHRGTIDFINNELTPGTGTMTVRGVFPNPDGQLTPNFTARMRVPGRPTHVATLLPEAAVGTNLAQSFVAVVGPDDVVQFRDVTPGGMYGGLQAVEGVKSDDRVIINGLMNARPGVKVRPVAKQVRYDESATTQPTTPAAVPGRPAGAGAPERGRAGRGGAERAAAGKPGSGRSTPRRAAGGGAGGAAAATPRAGGGGAAAGDGEGAEPVDQRAGGFGRAVDR